MHYYVSSIILKLLSRSEPLVGTTHVIDKLGISRSRSRLTGIDRPNSRCTGEDERLVQVRFGKSADLFKVVRIERKHVGLEYDLHRKGRNRLGQFSRPEDFLVGAHIHDAVAAVISSTLVKILDDFFHLLSIDVGNVGTRRGWTTVAAAAARHHESPLLLLLLLLCVCQQASDWGPQQQK